MGIWISVLVVLCLINAHVSANSKIGCVNAVTIFSGNGTQVYACQAQNKDNNIKWIRNGAGMQIVLATCLHGSTTCLTTQTSVSALRTTNGSSELTIVGDVDGSDIECHESSDSEDVTCLRRSTENPTSKQSVVAMTSAQDVIRGNTPAVSTTLNNVTEETVATTFAPTSNSPKVPNKISTSTKKTSYGVSTLKGNLITDTTGFHPQTLTQSGNTLEDSTILKTKSTVSYTSNLDTTVHLTLLNNLSTTEKTQQVSSEDSSVSGTDANLIPLSNITKLSAQSGTTSLDIFREGTLSSGTKHIPARTTVSPATASTQPEARTDENSHIAHYSEISSQTNTRYLVFESGFPQTSGSTMSSLPVAPTYSLSTEGESSMASTTVSYQNKPHVSSSLGSMSIGSSAPSPFKNTEPSVHHPQRSVSFHDNTKGLSSGDSSTFMLSSTEGSKHPQFTIHPETLTSKSSLRIEPSSPFTSKITNDGHFTNLETANTTNNVQDVLGSSAPTNEAYLPTSNAFIPKETELTSRGKSVVIASVKPTMSTSPLHETESTHFRSLTDLSTLPTQNVPTNDKTTVIASPKLRTDRNLKTDGISSQSHQGSVATGHPHIHSNTILSSTYDRHISVSTDKRDSGSSSPEVTQSTKDPKNQFQTEFSDQETPIISSAQVDLHSSSRQDVTDVTKLPSSTRPGFSTHESQSTTIDGHKATEADIYGSLSNILRSVTEVSTTASQFPVQTNKGPAGDDKTAKNNIVNQDPHRTSGTSSTVSPIPTSHDKQTPVSIIVGIIAAVLGVLILGSLYIVICKNHRDSMTFSKDVSSKEFIYCNIAYENEVNDEAKKVRDETSGVNKHEALRTLKANRRLSMSKACVLREEIESPNGMVASDANSVEKVSTAFVSMETDSVCINSAEAEDTDSDASLFAATSPGASSFEKNSSESNISDYGDEVTQHEENQKDLLSPDVVVDRANMPSAPRKAFIWRSLYDKMLLKEDDLEHTLYTTILIAKPSSCRRSIMKSRGLLEPVNESEEDLLYVEGKKPKKVVSFGDAEYATVSKVSHKPKGGEDSKEIQLQDTCPDSLQPPVYAVVNKLAPD